METARYVTVGAELAEGWVCVDDFGRRDFIPRAALASTTDPSIDTLRCGQRLVVQSDADVIVGVRMP